MSVRPKPNGKGATLRTRNGPGNGKSEVVEVSVVMPCLNEAESLASCIRKAQAAFRRLDVKGEVIVADNGSTDGSQAIAHDLGARVVDVKYRGYGSALMGGIAAARGRYILMGDADDSYDFGELGRYLERLREGDDLVMGNRFAGGILPGAMPPLHRYFGNPALSWLGRVFFKSRVGDFQCGLRAFRKDAITRLDLRTQGMEFASEMVVKASLYGLRVSEVPITLSPDTRSRAPHLRTWRDGWRYLRFLLLHSPRWLFLLPGLSVMAAGALAMAWLVPGPRRIGHFVLDVQTLMLAALAVVVGLQSVIFFVLAKVFAIGEGLLPDSPALERILRRVTLEACLLTGFPLLAAGGGGLFVAATSLRIIIPSVTALVVGLQMIMFGFFLSLLRLRRTPTWSPGTNPADDSIEVEAVHPDDGSRLRIRLGRPGVSVVDLEAAASGEA